MKRLKFIATATLLGLLTVSCQDDNNESVTPNAYQPIELTATETRLAMENNGFAFRFFRAKPLGRAGCRKSDADGAVQRACGKCLCKRRNARQQRTGAAASEQ